MKNNKIIGFIVLCVVFIISITVSILLRSNMTSLLINLVFTAAMFIILLLSKRHIDQFSDLISALKNGTEFLKARMDTKQVDSNDVFPTNMKLANPLNAYYKDNSGFDGDIADYINERLLDEVIHKQTTELAVSAMTGLGLLGTFIGLILGIKDLDVNQEQLMESIKTLMNGMKTAFLTSIFGVLYSLVFNLIYKKQYNEGLAALDEFYEVFYSKVASNPDNRNMNQLLEYQGQMVDGLNQLPASISTAIAAEIDKVFAPTINKMDHLMEQFVSVATTNQQEGLEVLVHSFVDSMNRILNDKFVMLAETLDKTCEMQNKNYEMMNQVVAETTAQIKHLSELNASVEQALSNIQQYVAAIENYNDSITKHNDETHKLITSVLESQNSTYTTVQELTRNITDANAYVSIVREIVDGLRSQLEAFTKQCSDIMSENAAAIEKANQDTAEIIEQYCSETTDAVDALNKQINAFTVISGNLITEIKTVGSRIHTECNGLENSLSTSLNGTFKVFDENLAEITTHLNSSIKEMQELVDRLPRDLYISIGKLKESMDQCVTRLNDSNAPKEGN